MKLKLWHNNCEYGHKCHYCYVPHSLSSINHCWQKYLINSNWQKKNIMKMVFFSVIEDLKMDNYIFHGWIWIERETFTILFFTSHILLLEFFILHETFLIC